LDKETRRKRKGKYTQTFLPDNNFLKLLGTTPLADAGQTEAVVAVLKDAEAIIRPLFLHYSVHADPALLVHAAGNGKRVLHIFFMALDTFLSHKQGKGPSLNNLLSNKNVLLYL
jgi:hypothetical protein